VKRNLMFVCVIAALLAFPLAGVSAQDNPVTINWWSHWANEPNKRDVIETFVADYMESHPTVEINLEWWDKNELIQALRNTLTAGEGFPDIFTMDAGPDGSDYVAAGWVLNLDPYVDWETQVVPAGYELYSFPTLGMEGTYGIPIEYYYDTIFYNKGIFEELGIEVPDDYTYTYDEWVDVMKTCAASEYAPVANAIGNRISNSQWPFKHALLAYAGPDDFALYLQGLKNWDTPEVRKALAQHIELSQIPIWPASFATMTIDEYHVYFYNQEKACAMYLATWYTGRAFKPADEGGQADDFHERLGMLRPVDMPDAEYNNLSLGAVGSGYAAAAMTEHPDIVGDILNSLASSKYGAMWVGKTASPTAVVYDPADVESEYGWYFDILNEVYGSVEVIAPNVNPACGEIDTAIADVIGEGIPLGIIDDADTAIEMLNEGLCEGAE